MEDLHLGAVEARFADLIWMYEPLSSRALVTLCGEELGWKKSTTYTVLKRLCDKGIFQNENGTVTSRMTKEEYAAAQSEKFVEDTFGGSLPAFVAAFLRERKLSPQEADELRRMLDESEGGYD